MRSSSNILLLLSRKGDLHLLSKLLWESGYHVFTELKEDLPPIDLILFDVRCPTKLMEEVLLFKRRATLFLPVIALVRTGAQVEGLYKIGFDDCLHYPLYKTELLKRLEFFLRFRRKLQELKEKEEDQRLKTLGFLALGIAHDFNNLLTPILGYVDLCLLQLQGRASAQTISHLQRVKDIVHKSKSLIDQIFLFCNPDQKPYKPLDVATEVANIEPLLWAAIPAHIGFQVKIKKRPVWVRIHPSKIHRLLFNLVTNAVKAIGDQSGSIGIEVSTKGPLASLVVWDTGCGLDEESKARLFELFYSSGKSSGIGLNIVKNIVEEAGGTIEVEGAPGKGTRFEIRLPLAETVPEETDVQPLVEKVSRVTQTQKKPRKILLVDDEFTILELLKQFFETQGFEVLTSSSGQKALEIFYRHPDIALVITDLYLPDLRGDELLGEIRKLSPKVPVILCSGVEGEKIAPHPRLKFLKKPFSLAELQDLMAELWEEGKEAGKGAG